MSINIASGDDNPNDPDLGTFNPLFPRGNYFSEAAVLGPRNFYNFHPFLILNPLQKLSFTADVNFFWRLKTEDSVYSPSGQIIRRPNGSKERFVGSTLSLTADYAVSDRLSFVAIHSHFVPGSFIDETGPSEDIDFTELTLQYRF